MKELDSLQARLEIGENEHAALLYLRKPIVVISHALASFLRA